MAGCELQFPTPETLRPDAGARTVRRFLYGGSSRRAQHANGGTQAERDRHLLRPLNGHAWLLEDAGSAVLEDHPLHLRTWEPNEEFESHLSEQLESPLYKAIVECTIDVQDKEAKKERRRILISINLYNQAHLYAYSVQPSPHLAVVLITAAFEALLNLSSTQIGATFHNAVSTLASKRTTLLKRWCKEFYEYRSSLVHGEGGWDEEEKEFVIGNTGLYHMNIATALFCQCLQTKLFLLGFLKDYEPQDPDSLFRV